MCSWLSPLMLLLSAIPFLATISRAADVPRKNTEMVPMRDGVRLATDVHMPSGPVYKLTIPLLDTALVFNKGHRIGLIVTGSNAPRYEVHPNSFEPVKSYGESPVAHVAIHAAAQYPSRLVLPEVVP